MTGEHPPVATAGDVAAATTPPGTPHSRGSRFGRAVGWGAFAGLVAGASVGTGILPVLGTLSGALFGTAIGLALGVVEAVALVLLPCTTAARPAVRVVGTVVAAVSGGVLADALVGEPELPGVPVHVLVFAAMCALAGFGVADASGYRLSASQAAGWRLAGTSLLVALGTLSVARLVLHEVDERPLLFVAPIVAGLVAGTAWGVVGAARLRRALPAPADGAPAVTDGDASGAPAP